MTATVEGLTARLDILSWVLDEHRTQHGQTPMWVDALKTLDDNELPLLLVAAIVTAAEAIQLSTRHPGASGPALLITQADRYGHQLQQLQNTQPRRPPAQATPEGRVTWTDVWRTFTAWATRRPETRR